MRPTLLYGSTVRSCSTSASKGSIPFLGEQRSRILAHLASQRPDRTARPRARSLAGAGARRPAARLAHPGLDRGFLVGADHVIAARASVPGRALIEVEDRSRPRPEPRVARKDPGAAVPRANRILGQPTPHGGAEELGDDPRLTASSAGERLTSGERDAPLRRRLARHRLDLRHLRGGKRLGRPAGKRSSKPARPSSKKRFRHSDTDWRATPSRLAKAAFDSPCAASRIALARSTTRHGRE